MKSLFDTISNESAVIITKRYSTSFSIAVRLLAPSIRQGVYNIYGFVRLADEIVDSFESYPKITLFKRFENEYQSARLLGISSNPVINAFQRTVEEYNINDEYVESFLASMKRDLTKKVYNTKAEIDEYIYGSADVVGLMCLKVFVNGDEHRFESLKDAAMYLGSAFQKVNFLRDLKQDFENLDRSYFPDVDLASITSIDKNRIIQEIKNDFSLAYKGIRHLPNEARLGVYVAYKYYLKLLKKIERTPARVLKEKRIRISNVNKTYLLFKSFMTYQLGIL